MASVKKLDKPAPNRDHRQVEILGANEKNRTLPAF
jgi:hypothetical protein